MPAYDLLAGLGALLFGGLGALGYVSRRFPGRVFSVATSWPGAFYVAAHAGVSVTAFLIILLFGWTFIEADSGEGQIAFTRAVVAGSGALAFMRTRVAFPVAGGDANIGPGESIDSILSELERKVVEDQATSNVKLVIDAFQGLEYSDVGSGVLASICLRIVKETRLAESVTREKLDALQEDLAILEDPENVMTDEVRSLLLGLALVTVFGAAVFTASVRGLENAKEATA